MENTAECLLHTIKIKMAEMQLRSRKTCAFYHLLESSRNIKKLWKHNAGNLTKWKSIVIQMIIPVKSETHFLGACPLLIWSHVGKQYSAVNSMKNLGRGPVWRAQLTFPDQTMSLSKQTWPQLLNDTSCSPNGKRTWEKNIASSSLFPGCFSCQNTVQYPCNLQKWLESSDLGSRFPSHAKPEPKTSGDPISCTSLARRDVLIYTYWSTSPGNCCSVGCLISCPWGSLL